MALCRVCRGTEFARNADGSISCVICGDTWHPQQEESQNKINDPVIQDSGDRQEFDTGAVRDISKGKGRCDLLPLDTVGHMLDSRVLITIELFKTTKNADYLRDAFSSFAEVHMPRPNDLYSAMLMLSQHFENGAEKYGENNWKKGIPLHCYIDSAVRHYLKFMRKDTDERHDLAFMWNILCAMWTLEHMPELDDIEKNLD